MTGSGWLYTCGYWVLCAGACALALIGLEAWRLREIRALWLAAPVAGVLAGGGFLIYLGRWGDHCGQYWLGLGVLIYAGFRIGVPRATDALLRGPGMSGMRPGAGVSGPRKSGFHVR